MKVETGGPSGAKLKNTCKSAGLTSDEADRVLALMKDAKTESVAIDAIRPNPRNARRHPPKQVAILAESIRNFGFTNPILVDEDGEIQIRIDEQAFTSGGTTSPGSGGSAPRRQGG